MNWARLWTWNVSTSILFDTCFTLGGRSEELEEEVEEVDEEADASAGDRKDAGMTEDTGDDKMWLCKGVVTFNSTTGWVGCTLYMYIERCCVSKGKT